MNNTVFIISFLIIFLSSCATYDPQVNTDYIDRCIQDLPGLTLDYRLYLAGNTGNFPGDTLPPALQTLQVHLAEAPENSAAVFLGDYTFPKGLPEEDAPGREKAELQIRTQLDMVKEFSGLLYFIPGHRDWKSVGVEGVRRVEEYIQDYLDRDEDVFIPDDGCSGPETESLSDNVSIMAIDSEWWLTEWDNHPTINKDCDLRTKEVFLLEVEDEFKDHRKKNLIVLMHHPLRTNGRYGGYHSFKEHIFPLTTKDFNIPIPLPFIGTMVLFLDDVIPSRQGTAHPLYRSLEDEVVGLAEDYGEHIFASSHDPNLQYIRDDNQHFIVSGSSASNCPAWMGGDARFTYGRPGFAVLNIYEDGSVWLEFWGAGVLPKGKLLFRRQIKGPLPTSESLTPDEFPEFEELGDSAKVSIADPGNLNVYNRFFWGDLHTDYYFEKLKWPVLNLAKVRGGLKPLKQGGGGQTNSLQLQDSLGHMFQLRSLKKRARKLPYLLDRTFVKDIFEHQLTAGNPYGAFLLAPMARAIGIYFIDPDLYYLPKQPNLGRYNHFGGELYLFGARPDENWEELEKFGKSEEIISTFDVLEERLENDKGVIDQRMVVRTRLFDMIVGDWDRHYDQWRWASKEIDTSDRTLYRPIPRDRDQVFAKYDGLVHKITDLTIPYLRAQHNFDEQIGKREIKWLNYQARNFDRFFLNELTWEDWQAEAKHIQKHLTDEVIEKSIQWLPGTIYSRLGPRLEQYIKLRRDNLVSTARRYYHVLNKKAKIPATYKDNLILIDRIDDETTQVRIYEHSDDRTHKDLIYEKSFSRSVTKEIVVYGMDGEDEFRVAGQVDKNILVRLVGGEGKDVFKDESKVSGLGKKTRIYDSKKEESVLEKGKEAADRRINRSVVNDFIYREFEYDYWIPVPDLGYNPDDGVFLGLNARLWDYGFKKLTTHQFYGNYSFATGAYNMGYIADFENLIDNWGAQIHVLAEGPQFVENFFGVGNETSRDSTNRDYYRVRQQRYALFPSVEKHFASESSFSIGPLVEMRKVQRTRNRITTSDEVIIDPKVFDWQYFGGIQFHFHYSNLDDHFIPTRGIDFKAGISWRAELENFHENFFSIGSNIIFYIPLVPTRTINWATRIGFDHRIGDFDFFQGARLGGPDNLRGFSKERFTGKTSFYSSSDLRIQLFYSKNSTVPFALGIAPGFDIGRVWLADDLSNKWHLSYGASLWVAPLNYIAVNAGVFASKEETRFTAGLGLQF